MSTFDDDLVDLFVEPTDGTAAPSLDDALFADRADYTMVPWLDQMLACRSCPARDEARRVVPGNGPLDAEIAIIGQNPGEEEDQMGVAFIGRSGAELDEWLDRLDLDRRKVLVTNALKCHTARNRAPRPKELATCRDLWLRQEVLTFAAVKVVITLGRPALQSVLSEKLPANLPQVMTPWWADIALDSDATRTALLLPLPHPAYLLRSPIYRDKMYGEVLPTVKTYLTTHAPEVYSRARRGAA